MFSKCAVLKAQVLDYPVLAIDSMKMLDYFLNIHIQKYMSTSIFNSSVLLNKVNVIKS
jgi:hypothetical protein